jgi:hypothetical protein
MSAAQPGPWTEKEHNEIVDATGKVISLYDTTLDLDQDDVQGAWETMQANRRLVIAAPQMRDMLRRFVDRFRIDPETPGHTSENVYVLVGEAERLLKQLEGK